MLFEEELALQLHKFTLNNCFLLISKLLKISLGLQEKIKSVSSVTDLLPKSESDLMIIIRFMELEITKLRKVENLIFFLLLKYNIFTAYYIY